MAYLSQSAIDQMGFRHVGKAVKISDKASFYNCANISIGDHCRIDDFCVLSAGIGGIEIGDYVHIAIYSSLVGAGSIVLSDFCNLSSRVSLFASNDDYSGASLTNPTVPAQYSHVTHADVLLEKHVIIGCGSVVMPGVTLKQGAAVGALSFVNQDCEAFTIYAGRPVIKVKKRKTDLLALEAKLRAAP